MLSIFLCSTRGVEEGGSRGVKDDSFVPSTSTVCARPPRTLPHHQLQYEYHCGGPHFHTFARNMTPAACFVLILTTFQSTPKMAWTDKVCPHLGARHPTSVLTRLGHGRKPPAVLRRTGTSHVAALVLSEAPTAGRRSHKVVLVVVGSSEKDRAAPLLAVPLFSSRKIHLRSSFLLRLKILAIERLN